MAKKKAKTSIKAPAKAGAGVDAKAAPQTRLGLVQAAAEVYGLRSFDNYVQIRSVAERLRDGLCVYLDDGQKCVYLVPPQGPFAANDYGSAAFSVSGKGFLPLEPMSFGLAVQVSNLGDYMRIVVHCRKEGDHIYLQIEDHLKFDFDMPFNDHDLQTAYEGLYKYLLGWFETRTDKYDNGHYGGSDIGFDIQRAISE
ncbi:MAG: hypothetical protein V3U82_02985 [Robiginitomaculum sp.]